MGSLRARFWAFHFEHQQTTSMLAEGSEQKIDNSVMKKIKQLLLLSFYSEEFCPSTFRPDCIGSVSLTTIPMR